ncbi:hypothetical protein OPV22_017458 [Ensete ventricosum]|uniref:Uncharacterized protein n=1 Tax=Ensete ventricosum TaxID=4639 RepID=A0AAV8QWD8_ENSVE|nr:hypothetical protein OPV22_017458 [Ensete ventricosum]
MNRETNSRCLNSGILPSGHKADPFFDNEAFGWGKEKRSIFVQIARIANWTCFDLRNSEDMELLSSERRMLAKDVEELKLGCRK